MTILDALIQSATQTVANRLSRQPREIFFENSVGKGSVAGNLAPPNQSANYDAIALACALLAVADDLQTFVLDDELLREFDLYREYGIDPQPLFHLNAYDSNLRHTVKAILASKEEPLESRYPSLCSAMHKVLVDRLLGAQTAGKMAYVKSVTGEPLSMLTPNTINERLRSISKISEPLRRIESRQLAIHVMALFNATTELLKRQRSRLPIGHDKRQRVEEMLAHLDDVVTSEDVLRFQLRSLSADDPRDVFGHDEFCRDYCDEILQVIARQTLQKSRIKMQPTWRCVIGRGIELAYVPRTVDFLLLGDRYGDCTARRSIKQMDSTIANIHWTVYSWLLDPFYRILQVYVDGEGVLKAHLTPLIVEGEAVLSIDAIEVVPELRNTLPRLHLDGQERPNRFLSNRLFELRNEIISALFATVLEIGQRMNVSAILVEKYSNGSWVRDVVGELPVKYYHISSVEKPFGTRPFQYLYERWIKRRDVELQTEIQATNLLLLDEGLREGYRCAGLLFGNSQTESQPLRGP